MFSYYTTTPLFSIKFLSSSFTVVMLQNQALSSLSCRMHVLAGVFPGGTACADRALVMQWEETYIKNMRYASQRLEEVRRKLPSFLGWVPCADISNRTGLSFQVISYSKEMFFGL